MNGRGLGGQNQQTGVGVEEQDMGRKETGGSEGLGGPSLWRKDHASFQAGGACGDGFHQCPVS